MSVIEEAKDFIEQGVENINKELENFAFQLSELDPSRGAGRDQARADLRFQEEKDRRLQLLVDELEQKKQLDILASRGAGRRPATSKGSSKEPRRGVNTSRGGISSTNQKLGDNDLNFLGL